MIDVGNFFKCIEAVLLIIKRNFDTKIYLLLPVFLLAVKPACAYLEKDEQIKYIPAMDKLEAIFQG